MTLHESKHAAYPDLSRFLPVEPGGLPTPPPPPVPLPLRALYKHADFGSDPDCFGRLARLADPEPWAARGDDTWILREYLDGTFERLYQQRQVPTSPDGAYSLFNTGLATAQQEALYGLFVPNRNPDGPPWALHGWLTETDRRLAEHFPVLPAFATYTSDPADYVYDWRCPVHVDTRTLLEDRSVQQELPAPLRSNPYVAGLVMEGAVRRAEARVRRSHRSAVPCWEADRVRMMLPLALTTAEAVDIALIITRDGDGYRGTGVLNLETAYARARQIARPEEWLTVR